MYTAFLQQEQHEEAMRAQTGFGAFCRACMQDKYIAEVTGHTFAVCPIVLLSVLIVVAVVNVALLALALILLVLVASVADNQITFETKPVLH